MQIGFLALTLFSSLCSALKPGDIVSGEYILVFPSTSTTYSTDAELMGGVTAMAQTYSERLGARDIQVLKTSRVPNRDHLLVNASEAAVRGLQQQGIQVFENRVVGLNGFQSNGTWAMARLNQRARNRTAKGFSYPDTAGEGVEVHIIDR
jgi:hypothetical protein